MDALFNALFRSLSAMFLVGTVGCVLVIPITAYRLFSTLFEKDRDEDQ